MNREQLIKEIIFTAVRSSGAGGQHVNKTSSKIVLRFNVLNSSVLTEDEKELIQKKLANKFNKEGDLIVTCEDTRSQHKNKEIAIDKFLKLIKNGLTVPKKRKKTKPSKQANKKRLEKKAKHALKKANRKNIIF